jgi:hypothetical protein
LDEISWLNLSAKLADARTSRELPRHVELMKNAGRSPLPVCVPVAFPDSSIAIRDSVRDSKGTHLLA